MKIKTFKSGWLFLLVSLCGLSSSAQISPGMFQQYLSGNSEKKEAGINYRKEILDFYVRIGYETAWIQQKDTTNLNYLLVNLSAADNWGLREKDYQYDFVSAFKKGNFPLQDLADSLKAEILFTDAAIHFYSDITYGNTSPALGYTGIKYIPNCMKVPLAMSEYISKNKVRLLTSFLSPKIAEVRLIENKIVWILQVMNEKDFKEIRIASKKMDVENKLLCHKLYQLGILDSANANIPGSILKQKIKEAQLMFHLPVTGELNQDIIRELNLPIQVRLQQLNLSINYYRWLSCLTQIQPVIVVNIPAAYLKVYNEQNVNLEMRMVVGKPSTPTFTLASVVNEVIIYPYWYVPFSIATKELLPAIKRNPSYLDANNYQVLSKAGKVMDPYSINWQVLSRNYFPYIIRQGTGCDNSLGLLKLNFYNPFGAYLHDTPAKDLFKQHRRFYSHGCMRMEKPMELGHLVLKNNSIAIDTITEKGCLKSQSPVVVPADVKMPVIVWYNPVGIDSTGSILFFEDVYKKFNWDK